MKEVRIVMLDGMDGENNELFDHGNVEGNCIAVNWEDDSLPLRVNVNLDDPKNKQTNKKKAGLAFSASSFYDSTLKSCLS